MTGFDPTAPQRDTEQDEPDEFPDNVVPPDALTDDTQTDDVPAPSGDTAGPAGDE